MKDDIERAEESMHALKEELEQAHKYILQLERERDVLREKLHWIDELLAVPSLVMSASHKITLQAAVKAYQAHIPDEEGWVAIESWKVCRTAGQSKETFLTNLAYCEQLGVLQKKCVRPHVALGDYTATLSIQTTDLLPSPNQYRASTARVHGGRRSRRCPSCGSAELDSSTTYACRRCKHIHVEKRNSMSFRTSADSDGFVSGTQEDGEKQRTECKERQVLEQQCPSEDAMLHQHTEEQNGQASLSNTVMPFPAGVSDEQEEMSSAQEQHEVLMRAACLYVALARSGADHAEMSINGAKKYYEVHRPFGIRDALEHLTGQKTKAVVIGSANGMTRALLWDADTHEDLQRLNQAGRVLQDAGYAMLIEPSPARRGGHLATIFSHEVDAVTAYQHMCSIAPTLSAVREHWPGSPNKIRLPAGLYCRRQVNMWCTLSDGHGHILAHNGVSAAHLLLRYQTPSSMIPTAVTEDQNHLQCTKPSITVALPCKEGAVSHELSHERQDKSRDDTDSTLDARWWRQYGDNAHVYWFHHTTATVISWFNERYYTWDFVREEANGMVHACYLGRNERTASVGLTRDGKWWTDFGAGARQDGDKQDGGDVFELLVRVEAAIIQGERPHDSRSAIMREVKSRLVCHYAQEMRQAARADLEDAARRDVLPTLWVQQLMSQAGWDHYQKERKKHHGQSPLSQ